MRGRLSIAAAGILALAGCLVPTTRSFASPASIPSGCSGAVTTTPSPGLYTGTWHSDGDYHFDGQFQTFTMDVELKVTIDGTLNLTVGPNGQVSGTATGTVDAPVYREGVHDISSGTGTISGAVTGSLSSSGLTLVAPTIDMQWGTFEGTQERFITMPDYQLPVSGAGIVTDQGTIAENGFPVQNLVADGTGEVTQAPGIGTASGTWQVTSDEQATFNQLSQEVSGFIASANGLLQSPGSITPGEIESQFTQPLATLQANIAAHPDLAPNLQSQIDAWEASALPTLYTAIRNDLAVGDLSTIRLAEDLLAATNELPNDCQISDGGDASAIHAALSKLLNQSASSGDWQSFALTARESLLAGTPSKSLAATIATSLAPLLSGTDSPATRVAGRIAYAFGDTHDAKTVAALIPTKKTRKLGPHLLMGLPHLSVAPPTGTQPTFSWQPVINAGAYIVTISDAAGLAWTWSGPQTSVTYGDTTLDGSPDNNRPWPSSLTVPYSLSILALNSQGQIIAARLHVPIHS